jgi:dienelactone hydrolase
MLCRLTMLFAAVIPCAPSAIPDSDIRNLELPDHKTHFRMPNYQSRQQWAERKEHLRKQILNAAGLLPMPTKTPLHPTFLKHNQYDGYSIDVVLIETLPGYFLGGNLYRPTGTKAPAPAVLVPHGHWKGGRLENQPSYSVPALGINLARQGYVVFAYDMVGFNDTRQIPHSFDGWAEDLWGFHPMGLQLWNSIRALDFLETLRDVDSKRIAVTGASGGATQTFLLTAVDDRVKYAAPVNMVSAYMQGGDPCEEAPGLRPGTFNVEFAAMAAPRPMLVVSSTRDWTRHTPLEEFPAIRRIYALLGSPGAVENVHIDAEHNYNRQSREAVYSFLAKYMHPEHAQVEDQEVQVPPEADLLAFPKPDAKSNLPGFDELFDRWKAAAILQMQNTADLGTLREALGYALGAYWPTRVESRLDGNRVVLSRAGVGDRVTGHWTPGKGNPVLIIHPDGSAAGLHMNLAEQAHRDHRPVLLIDPFRNRPTRSMKEQRDEYFFSYNRTEAALRVQDILTALAFLKEQSRGRPELIGLGDSGPWSIFAAAIAPIQIDVLADLNGFGGSDQDFRDRFYVPGIQRAGGLATALRLTNRLRAALPAPGRPAEDVDVQRPLLGHELHTNGTSDIDRGARGRQPASLRIEPE